MPKKYPDSFRERAVRMVADRLDGDDRPSQYAVVSEIAPKLGISAETFESPRVWWRV